MFFPCPLFHFFFIYEGLGDTKKLIDFNKKSEKRITAQKAKESRQLAREQGIYVDRFVGQAYTELLMEGWRPPPDVPIPAYILNAFNDTMSRGTFENENNSQGGKQQKKPNIPYHKGGGGR